MGSRDSGDHISQRSNILGAYVRPLQVAVWFLVHALPTSNYENCKFSPLASYWHCTCAVTLLAFYMYILVLKGLGSMLRDPIFGVSLID